MQDLLAFGPIAQ